MQVCNGRGREKDTAGTPVRQFEGSRRALQGVFRSETQWCEVLQGEFFVVCKIMFVPAFFVHKSHIDNRKRGRLSKGGMLQRIQRKRSCRPSRMPSPRCIPNCATFTCPPSTPQWASHLTASSWAQRTWSWWRSFARKGTCFFMRCDRFFFCFFFSFLSIFFCFNGLIFGI